MIEYAFNRDFFLRYKTGCLCDWVGIRRKSVVSAWIWSCTTLQGGQQKCNSVRATRDLISLICWISCNLFFENRKFKKEFCRKNQISFLIK